MEVTFQRAQYCRCDAGVPMACKGHQCLTADFGIRFRKSLMKRYPEAQANLSRTGLPR
jgi:hypothetical protein